MAEVHTRMVTLYLFHHDDDSAAVHAVLRTPTGTVTGRSRTLRMPPGEPVPDAAQDVAAASALRDLAERLLCTTSDDADHEKDERRWRSPSTLTDGSAAAR